ncbi:MAG: hypothetical protein HXX81_03615, partial [Campylobacterales bacterium]|nr:hypothetical protein [Campylobacterales bacterium]
MSKFRISIIASSLMFGTSVFADTQTLTVKNGWNLLGSKLNGVTVNSTLFKNATTVWKWTGSSWQAFSPNGTLATKLSDANIPKLTEINAGNGFWVNSSSEFNITLNGSAPTSTKIELATTGWHLLSPLGSSGINVTSTFSDSSKYTTIWKWTGSSWQAYSPDSTLASKLSAANIANLSKISVGDGFWVNNKQNSSIDGTVEMPPVVSGKISLDGLTSSKTTNKMLSKTLYDTTTDDVVLEYPPQVQLYDTSDTEFTTPLLKAPVTGKTNGSYTITADDFNDPSKADSNNSYIVRAFVKKD